MCPKHNFLEMAISFENGYKLHCGAMRSSSLPGQSGVTFPTPAIEGYRILTMEEIHCLGKKHLPGKWISPYKPKENKGETNEE